MRQRSLLSATECVQSMKGTDLLEDQDTTKVGSGRSSRVLTTVAVWLACMLAFAPKVAADFGIAEINTPDTEAAPAFPGTQAAWAGGCHLADPSTSNGGVGAAEGGIDPPAARPHCIAPGNHIGQSSPDLWFGAPPNWRLDPVTQAGSRPDGTVSMALEKTQYPGQPLYSMDDNIRSMTVSLPPGLVANPEAVPKCSALAAANMPPACPPESQIGIATIGSSSFLFVSRTFPIYAVEARESVTAEVSVGFVAGLYNIPVTASARTDDDFGINSLAVVIPTYAELIGQTITLWGVPWAAEHDKWRTDAGSYFTSVSGTIPATGHTPANQQSYDPSWGPIKPFFTAQTECSGENPEVTLRINSWQDSDTHLRYSLTNDAVTGCEKVPFDAKMHIAPTTVAADAATGLNVELNTPQNNEPPFDPPAVDAAPEDVSEYVDAAAEYWASDQGLATAHLDKAVVTLPPGISVNPSAATGLQGCADSLIGVREQGNPPKFHDNDPFDPALPADQRCPEGSKIGTVSVETPLLADPLGGDIVLGEPKSTDPTSGEMIRLFLVLRDRSRGFIGKIYGSAVANPANGRLMATFDKNPRLPFERMRLRFKGGPRGMLATPVECGSRAWNATFTPWTAAHGAGGVPVGDGESSFRFSERCGAAFAPGLIAGMDNRTAREGGAFSFKFSREDGHQRLKGLTAKLPTGLLASVRGVPLCRAAQAAAGACPEESRIGSVDAKAGSGNPFTLERKGEVFLTEGYKGGEYGLAVKIRPIAGPFRDAMEMSPIIVRQALHVDNRTAQVTAISDPLPLIHHGIPLRVREVTVLVDRPNFMLNPSNCSPKQVRASLLSAEGTLADLASHFQVTNCAALPFEPRIRMQNLGKGRRSTLRSWNPRMRFVVRQQGTGEAGISSARVTLPSSVILDQSNLDTTCTRAQMAAEDCPAGSIVGYARAFSPLLNRPVQGPVYLAANGGVRPLPDVVAVLDGEIRVVLESWIDTVRRGETGRLRATFNVVPDAPVSRFVLTMRGGKNRGLLVNSTDMCRTKERAVANFWGYNGKRTSIRPRVGLAFNGCRRARRQIARRVAKRKAARKVAARSIARRAAVREGER